MVVLVSGARSAQALGPLTLLQDINTGQSIVGIALDGNGNIRTSHNIEGTIKTHTPAGVQIGNFVFSTTPFESPDGLAVDAAGNSVVVDGNAFTIKTFTAGGALVSQFSDFTTNIWDVVVLPGGDYLVSGNNFIRRYTPGGTKIADIGSGFFSSGLTWGLDLDSFGNIYAVQPIAPSSIEKFDSSGTHLASIPVADYSKDVAVDNAGNMYVTHPGIDRVNIYGPTGTLLDAIPVYINPRGIEVDSSGKIYVVGTGGNIFIYEPSSPPPPPDADGDGVSDDQDAFPHSNTGPTVVVGVCDTGVTNQGLPNGATFNDLIGAIVAKHHGDFVSAVAKLTNDWMKAGLISGSQKGRITSCAAHGATAAPALAQRTATAAAPS
jgi:hypothetical protein